MGVRGAALRCEQCGRVGTRQFHVYAATELTPAIVVCRADRSCLVRRERQRSGWGLVEVLEP